MPCDYLQSYKPNKPRQSVAVIVHTKTHKAEVSISTRRRDRKHTHTHTHTHNYTVLFRESGKCESVSVCVCVCCSMFVSIGIRKAKDIENVCVCVCVQNHPELVVFFNQKEYVHDCLSAGCVCKTSEHHNKAQREARGHRVQTPVSQCHLLAGGGTATTTTMTTSTIKYISTSDAQQLYCHCSVS